MTGAIEQHSLPRSWDLWRACPMSADLGARAVAGTPHPLPMASTGSYVQRRATRDNSFIIAQDNGDTVATATEPITHVHLLGR